MSNEYYYPLEIAGEAEGEYLREAHDAWIASLIEEASVWPPILEEIDWEPEPGDFSDLPDPVAHRDEKQSDEQLHGRPFRYDTRQVQPDGVQPFLEFFQNTDLGGELRNILEQMISSGRLRSLTDISVLFREKLDEAISHKGFAPAELRDADKHFSNGRSVYGSAFGRVSEPSLKKTAAWALASANPGIYRLFAGIFVADLNARLQAFVLRALRAEDYAMSYQDYAKIAYSAGIHAVERGLSLVQQQAAEKSLVRRLKTGIRRMLDLHPGLRKERRAPVNEVSESHAILFGRRFKLRRGETRAQRLERYRTEYPRWARDQLVELEKQHLRALLAAGYASQQSADQVTADHLLQAEELLKAARSTPGMFHSSKELIDIACGGNAVVAGNLVAFFDKHRRRGELVDEIYKLGRTASRLQAGRRAIRAEDKRSADLVVATAVLRSNFGVPTIPAIQAALKVRGFSVTAMQAGRIRIPGVERSLTKQLAELESRVRTSAGTATIGDLSADDVQAARDIFRGLVKLKRQSKPVRDPSGQPGDEIPKSPRSRDDEPTP